MPTKVSSAFDIFLQNSVNLEKERTKKATSSRDWLVQQILDFPKNDYYFPAIFTEKNIYFGSFARKTKKRPLDDIDIMITLNAAGCSYLEYSDRIEINVPNNSSIFKTLCFENTLILNSKKIVNLFLNKLKNIPQYENANIKRNMEAVTLKLKSYEWNFDIVPCFFTTKDIYNKTYYIIPDGNGNWKKTDPRIDRERVKTINQMHNGKIHNIIRIAKYWNKRPTMPTMSSYLIENILLDYYEKSYNEASDYIDIEIINVFEEIKGRILQNVYDPKGIQGNINDLSYEEKIKVSNRAKSDYEKALMALQYEKDDNHKESIKKWGEIFGDEFPKYE